jgi:hypothetical protein
VIIELLLQARCFGFPMLQLLVGLLTVGFELQPLLFRDELLLLDQLFVDIFDLTPSLLLFVMP